MPQTDGRGGEFFAKRSFEKKRGEASGLQKQVFYAFTKGKDEVLTQKNIANKIFTDSRNFDLFCKKHKDFLKNDNDLNFLQEALSARAIFLLAEKYAGYKAIFQYLYTQSEVLNSIEMSFLTKKWDHSMPLLEAEFFSSFQKIENQEEFLSQILHFLNANKLTSIRTKITTEPQQFCCGSV